MKKVETKKVSKEIKKKAAPAAKKAAPKVKKAVALEAKPKSAHAEAVKAEAPKIVHHEKPHAAEEHRHAPLKKKPAKTVQYHGTGGRKTSVARVWMSKGSGNYNINGKLLKDYTCGRKLLLKVAMDPFVATNTVGKYDTYANANGGGICSQIGAVREAVSEAMMLDNPGFRAVLKKAGFLTRDPRMKERKKYGQKRARKRFQFSKR
jgi:small subunit ribosomal protein S9